MWCLAGNRCQVFKALQNILQKRVWGTKLKSFCASCAPHPETETPAPSAEFGILIAQEDRLDELKGQKLCTETWKPLGLLVEIAALRFVLQGLRVQER